MKRPIIGGFLTLSGTIGAAIMIVLAVMKPADEWNTPPGLMLTTMWENGTLLFFAVFLIFLLVGLFLLVKSYREK